LGLSDLQELAQLSRREVRELPHHRGEQVALVGDVVTLELSSMVNS